MVHPRVPRLLTEVYRQQAVLPLLLPFILAFSANVRVARRLNKRRLVRVSMSAALSSDSIR